MESSSDGDGESPASRSSSGDGACEQHPFQPRTSALRRAFDGDAL